jgi:alpha-1,2-mannosyltransferase
MGLFFTLLSLIISTTIAVVFLPQTLCIVGKPLGLYLQRSSRDRRDLLLARVVKEQRDYDAKHRDEDRKSEDDWEQVESSMTGSAVNGARAEEDWRGIVGFFHPFW